MSQHALLTAEGNGPDQVFLSYLRQGKFMIQRCRATGQHFFFPRVMAPGTGSRDLEWVEASGDGVVYSTTVMRQRPEKGGDYNIALIDLAEGPRMMSRVVDVPPEEVRIGMKVKAVIHQVDGQPLVVFHSAIAQQG